MENNSLETPVTNRGVTSTRENQKAFENKSQTNLLEHRGGLYDFQGEINTLSQYILFDWFQFTIPIKEDDNINNCHYESFHMIQDDELLYIDKFILIKKRIYELFKYLFNIDSKDLFYEEHGINGYTQNISYDNIRMYFNPFRVDMGINVVMSGSGCRDFDILGLDYKKLIRKVNELGGSYSRVDVAIDDFTNKYFTLGRLKHYIDNKLVISNFRTYYYMTKGIVEDNVKLGETLQFGSRASAIQITFYDKLKERKNNNYIVSDDVKYWVRTELRFRNEKVSELFEYYLNDNKNGSLNKYVKGVLHEYIRFLIKNKNDTNYKRWNTAEWWLKYLENVDRIKFVPRTLEASITRKKAWVADITSKSGFMCLIADIPNLKLDDNTTNYLYQYFKLGQEKIKDKDIQQLNAYRLSKGYNLLEKDEIKDYIRDIKDNLIAMEEITLDELNARNNKLNTTSDNLYYVNLYILKSLFYSIYIMLYLLNKLI